MFCGRAGSVLHIDRQAVINGRHRLLYQPAFRQHQSRPPHSILLLMAVHADHTKIQTHCCVQGAGHALAAAPNAASTKRQQKRQQQAASQGKRVNIAMVFTSTTDSIVCIVSFSNHITPFPAACRWHWPPVQTLPSLGSWSHACSTVFGPLPPWFQPITAATCTKAACTQWWRWRTESRTDAGRLNPQLDNARFPSNFC